MKILLARVLKPIFWLGIFVSVSCLLFVAFFHNFSRIDAAITIAMVALSGLLQLAAFIGVMRYPDATLWPSVCMVLAGPATVFCGIAGPSVIFSFPLT